MNVRFIAGFTVIVNEAVEGRRFYGEKLSLPVTRSTPPATSFPG